MIHGQKTAGFGNGRKEVPVISFAHLEAAIPMPDLLDVQRKAFAALLETGVDGIMTDYPVLVSNVLNEWKSSQ